MSTHKVVRNSCYGGFSLSDAACKRLNELGAKGTDAWGCRYVCRHDPFLIQVIEEMGEDANGLCAKLYIEEIEGNIYRISEYDGIEDIIEPADQEWIHINDE